MIYTHTTTDWLLLAIAIGFVSTDLIRHSRLYKQWRRSRSKGTS